MNTRQSPHVACLFTGALALVASIVFGAIYGALNFASWLSYFATLFFIAAYLLISVGLIRFMWRDYRSEFNWIRHAALPVISIAAMIWVLWGNIHPYPPGSAALVHLRDRRRPAHRCTDRASGWRRPGRKRCERAGLLLADVELEHEDATGGSRG